MEEAMQCPQCGEYGPYWVSATGSVACAKCYHVIGAMAIDPAPPAREDVTQRMRTALLDIHAILNRDYKLDAVCDVINEVLAAVTRGLVHDAPPASAPEAKETTSPFCPVCGKPIEPGHRALMIYGNVVHNECYRPGGKSATPASAPDLYVIEVAPGQQSRRGRFERPERAGYTNAIAEAGKWPLAKLQSRRGAPRMYEPENLYGARRVVRIDMIDSPWVRENSPPDPASAPESTPTPEDAP